MGIHPGIVMRPPDVCPIPHKAPLYGEMGRKRQIGKHKKGRRETSRRAPPNAETANRQGNGRAPIAPYTVDRLSRRVGEFGIIRGHEYESHAFGGT